MVAGETVIAGTADIPEGSRIYMFSGREGDDYYWLQGETGANQRSYSMSTKGFISMVKAGEYAACVAVVVAGPEQQRLIADLFERDNTSRSLPPALYGTTVIVNINQP